jgi:hypothetical protein
MESSSSHVAEKRLDINNAFFHIGTSKTIIVSVHLLEHIEDSFELKQYSVVLHSEYDNSFRGLPLK